MTSTGDADANLRRAFDLLGEAVARGADIVALPENFYYLRTDPEKPVPALSLDSGPVEALRGFAEKNKIHLLAGTIPEEIPGGKKTFNTSMLIMPDGEITAAYRKIHLFDVDIPDGGACGAVHRESE
ncbi:MAG: nitrilase-related carbon-nitrogen hydrolase, partial [bacterium]